MAETGHARNVQRFQEMVTFVAGWGPSYDPTNPAILLAALQSKLTGANAAIDSVSDAVAQLKNAQNERENKFGGLRKLTTRMVNYYDSTGAAANKVADAKSLKRKIDGKRAETLVDDPSTPEDESAGGISVSQQSYTQLVEHFDNLLELFGQDPLYDPNETDLTIATNDTLSTEMKTANTNVINNNVNTSMSRGGRDTELYADDSGLVDVAMFVKKYVKAAYGTDSMQYNQIKGLEFTRPTG